MRNVWGLIKRLHRKYYNQRANKENDGQASDAKAEPLASTRNVHRAWRQESSESWPPNEADYGQVHHLRDTESEWEMWTSW